jgi:uncharacterized protein (DUF58 family)
VTPRPSFRIGGYGFLVIAGMCAGLASGRPEAAILAVPFALHLAVGLALGAPPALTARHALGRDRAVEGDVVELVVDTGHPAVEVAPMLPAGLDVLDRMDVPGRVTLRLRPTRWGAFDLGTAAVRATDPLRLWRCEAVVASKLVLRVHPSTERLRRAVTAAELQPFVGQHTSRRRGEGFEFAELRPYTVGDRSARVNWRASARRGALWVNDRHPDHSNDVVLLLDTFGVEHVDRVELLDASVRTLAALAKAYERTHDRVGLLTFGGHLRWLRPGAGRTNLVRIVDGLLDAERLLTEVWSDVLRVPVGALPPKALLLAVSSLDSDVAVSTLVDLRARGFDVAALTVEPPSSGDARTDRLDALLRDARRKQLERLGVAVAGTGGGVAAAVEEVSAWRRRVPRLHA